MELNEILACNQLVIKLSDKIAACMEKQIREYLHK